MATVSVIVATRAESLTALDRLVSSIAEQHRLPEELILCSDRVRTEIRDRLLFWRNKHPQLRDNLILLEVDQPGLAVAWNSALKIARGEILLFTSDHCVMQDPTFVYKHEEQHRHHSQALIVGGPYRLGAHAKLLESVYHWNRDLRLYELNRSATSPVRETLAGNTSLKRSLLNSLRFDEDSLDPMRDFCRHIQSLGQTIHWEADLAIQRSKTLSLALFAQKSFRQGFCSFNRAKTPGPAEVPATDFVAYLKEHEVPVLDRCFLRGLSEFYYLLFHWGYYHATTHLRAVPSEANLWHFLEKTVKSAFGWYRVRQGFANVKSTLLALALLQEISKAKENETN